jgi:two-component system nitrate/nitrite response regulator NarL
MRSDGEGTPRRHTGWRAALVGSGAPPASVVERLEQAGVHQVAFAAAPELVDPETVDVVVVTDAALLAETLTWRAGVRPTPAVVAFPADADDAPPSVATDRDGWAIVPAGATTRELSAAIAAAAAGFAVRPAGGSDPRGYRRAPVEGGAAEVDALEEPLTPREQDVLQLVALGLSNRRVADRLGISEHTVKFHVASIYGKLGVSGRMTAVNRALRRGLLRI